MTAESQPARTSARLTVVLGIVLGVIVGVFTVKVMDGWPHAAAEGEEVAGKQTFTMQARTFREAARAAAPAVVNVRTIERVLVADTPRGLSGFEMFYSNRNLKEGRRIRGIGSGFIIDAENGYILTNNHVVEGGEEWQVQFGDKRELSAQLVGRDPKTDIAILQVKATDIQAAKLGNSDEVEVGDWVIAAGNPFGLLEQSVTAGIISAKGRRGLGLTAYEDFLQTDAAINQGNSGGPLVNLDGEVIGVNTAIYSRSGGYQGIGFAIPINQAKKIADKLIRDGRVIRGWMGVQLTNVPPSVASDLKLEKGVGIMVDGVFLRGPAHVAGILPEDIVVAVDGKPITDPMAIRDNVADLAPGTSMKLKLFRRAGKTYNEKTVTVKLTKQPVQLGMPRRDTQ